MSAHACVHISISSRLCALIMLLLCSLRCSYSYSFACVCKFSLICPLAFCLCPGFVVALQPPSATENMEGPWGALHETFNAVQLRSVLLCSACSQAQTSPSSSAANWIVFQCSQFSPAEAFGKAFSIHIQNRHSIHIRLICLFHYFHSASWNHHGVFPSQGPVSFLGRWMAPGPDNPTSQLLPIIRKSGWSGTEKEERKKDMVEAGRSF